MEEITQAFWRASEQRRICRIQMHGEPLTRMVHPYGICRTSGNKIVLVCWQAMGFTRPGGTAGFRNLILEDCEEVEVLDQTFDKTTDFNPTDVQYKDWVYHI